MSGVILTEAEKEVAWRLGLSPEAMAAHRNPDSVPDLLMSGPTWAERHNAARAGEPTEAEREVAEALGLDVEAMIPYR